MIQKLLAALSLAALTNAQWGSGEAEHVMKGLGDKFDPKNPTEAISEETLLKEQQEDAQHKAFAGTRAIIEKYEGVIDTLDNNIARLEYNRANAVRSHERMDSMCKSRYCQYYNNF